MDITKIRTPELSHIKSIDWDFVYEPAEDSFLLLDALEQDLAFLRAKKPGIVLEVGSGSGIIITAVSNALNDVSHCMAIDINSHACRITKSTSDLNENNVDVIQGDLTSCLRESTVDLIIFNPPYVVTPSEEVIIYIFPTPESDFELNLTSCLRESTVDLIIFNPPYVVTPSEEINSKDLLTKSWAGGKDGVEVINKFLATFPNKMAPKSFGYIVLLRENNPEEIMKVLQQKHFECEILNKRKVRGEELFVVKFIKTN